MCLKQLAKHLAIDIPQGATLFQTLRLLIEGTVEVSEEELAKIMGKRCMEMQTWGYTELLRHEGVLDVYDQKDFEKDLLDAEAGDVLVEDFAHEVRTFTRSVRDKLAEPAKFVSALTHKF